MKSEYLYKSKFNWFSVSVMLFMLILVGVPLYITAFTLNNLEINSFFSREVLAGIIFGVLFLFILWMVLRIKRIGITKEFLELKYLFTGYKLLIPWDDIKELTLKYSPTSDNASFNKMDRKYRIISSNRKITLYAHFYNNFKKFSVELDKRLPSHLKKNMKFKYKEDRKKLFMAERNYQKRSKYITVFGIIVLVIILTITIWN